MTQKTLSVAGSEHVVGVQESPPIQAQGLVWMIYLLHSSSR
jgi:hypothetical protein